MAHFCQRLLQTPSLSGDEGPVARLIRAEMERLRYDDVWTDAVGNVIGRMKGGSAPSIQFNCHMDQVDTGDPSGWARDPFGGEWTDGTLWGRGASDTKGALATQLHALARLREIGRNFPGDAYMACVIQEETGSWGTKHLLTHLKTDLAVLGEATANQIANGHRGRTELIVSFHGASGHASAASQDENAVFALGAFLRELRELPLPAQPVLGSSLLTPTRVYSDQSSGNMTPALVTLHLDWRSVPGADLPSMLAALRGILARACPKGVTTGVELLSKPASSYTGAQTDLPAHAPPYYLDPRSPLPSAARQVLEASLNRPVSIHPWGFATDGGYLVEAGIPTIGYSPCEERYAHTVRDQVSLSLMEEAFQGTMALALNLPQAYLEAVEAAA